MVDSVDWIIGQVVHTLETTDDPRNSGHKLIDNTFVFISSDNGGAQKLRNWKNGDGRIEFEKVTDNAPLREGKAWAYEGGCRIPFLVMGPGIEANTVNTRTPINLIDLFPTFLAIAGGERGKLDLDGCNLLPVIKGQQQTPRFVDGKQRDTVYLHYPVLNAAFSTIRRGPWKLMKNTGGSLNTAPRIQLFRLYNEDGSSNDLSETKNLASEYPEITKRMLADLDVWLKDHSAGVPYKNAAYRPGDLPGQTNVPKVIRRGTEGATLSVWIEEGKSSIVDAFLLYTTNPGKTEEWFRTGVRIDGHRIDANAPPGMTHGVICLIDENNFLVTSEPIPSMQKLRLGQPVSEVLKNGFAYRPGLLSLINTAMTAREQATQTGQDIAALQQVIEAAETTARQPVEKKSYGKAISHLRKQIRALRVPAARHAALNWYPRRSEW